MRPHPGIDRTRALLLLGEDSKGQPIGSALLLVSDLVEAVARAAVLSGIDIHLLHGRAADELDNLGGVAARLYYAVPDQTLTAADASTGT